MLLYYSRRENKLTAIGSTRRKNCNELPASDRRWLRVVDGNESYVIEQKFKKKKQTNTIKTLYITINHIISCSSEIGTYNMV